MKKYAEATISRRKFLGSGAVLGAGVVAAVALPNAAVAAVKQDIDSSNLKTEKEEGYRMTKHIADYYKSASL